jgi:ABC-2 type transport system ATP-binding protein
MDAGNDQQRVPEGHGSRDHPGVPVPGTSPGETGISVEDPTAPSRDGGTRPVAIRAEGLVKRYGDHRALDGFDLTVAAGTVCGLLGPNGAGKTTAVRILTTLLHADDGAAEVAGADVRADAETVRHRIGLSGQEPAVDEILSGRQNLVLFGRLNGLTKAAARRRATELLEQLDLVAAADKAVKHYSGGMRRRLDLGVTLILAPSVLFLDEPTTGLDPRNRAEVWAAIRAFVAQGTTVLLTTQYLDEADQLADDIVVMEAGRVIARGTPDELKALVGADQLDVVVAEPGHGAGAPDGPDDALERAAVIIAASATGTPEIDRARRTVSAPVAHRAQAITAVVQALAAAGITVDDIGLRRPTLDDVFLKLTGHRAEPPDGDPDGTDDPDAGDPSASHPEPTDRPRTPHQEVAA